MKKIALITGGSSGIGKAIALHLFQKGYKVYVTSRKATAKSSEGLHYLQMDVNNSESVIEAVNTLKAEEKRIDVLINSAGIGIIGSIEELPIDTVKEVFETNFFGLTRVCQAVAPIMRAQGSGHIINISSIAGEAGLPFRGHYSASKFAVEGMTEALRMELMPFGVKVCIIQPGDFNTNISQHRKGIEVDRSSPYYEMLQVVNDEIANGMETAPTPERVGPFTEKILNSNSPNLRYRVGALLETITPILKKFLPYKTYEKLIMNHYKMNQKK
ncbi:SDR family oxidoreductase [Aureibacter tunicatorum]|uniref:NAD(P)-dependent dehydrogenase (Short-subunit alcohol dehydrogenase family) n=1 Tax=Aureibacter tunicatorum TaxID=866807 RepID=A0AAE4BTB6_9BACT|nr:SDR family oxidoreductase [Aureibacter tunicatorum]MDR6239397.1 NAD(P)-dependent dehydrogenase (short-subunit alcohol dehydrogenase family) [Aureibacter tunicatorum]BDD04680.1 short-chain dehydrogenase/reductase [Aureibacter tunicatorum]